MSEKERYADKLADIALVARLLEKLPEHLVLAVFQHTDDDLEGFTISIVLRRDTTEKGVL